MLNDYEAICLPIPPSLSGTLSLFIIAGDGGIEGESLFNKYFGQ
jgi:hypothetical protein